MFFFELLYSDTLVALKIDVLEPPDSVRPLDESNPDEAELLIRRGQKEDSNAVIHSVRLKPLHKSRMAIPLCRLRCLPLVRPINDVDVSRLENEFVMGYRDGDRALYVSAYNNLDEQLYVTDDIQASWSTFWQEANEEFDKMLQNDSDLAHLAGKMFYVWEGNHRLTAWWRHIQKHHSLDKAWHISVDCIVVDPRNCTAVFLNAMNDINWYVFDLIYSSIFGCMFSLSLSSSFIWCQVHGTRPCQGQSPCQIASHSDFWKDEA